MSSKLPSFSHFSGGITEANRAPKPTCGPTEAAERGLGLVRIFSLHTHPLREALAERSRRTWLGSRGQIIVGAVCLHNAEHCLRPKAQRHPLARLSEPEPRGQVSGACGLGWSKRRRRQRALPGARRSPAPRHIPSQYCKHKSSVCF